MIKGISNLSYTDKYFMMNNQHLFSLPIRSTINFNSREWDEEIKNNLSKINSNSECNIETINNDKINRNNSNTQFFKLFLSKYLQDNMKDGNIIERITKFLLTIYNESEFDTKESIVNILLYIQINMNMDIFIQYPEIRKETLKLIFNSHIPYMLKAYEIKLVMDRDVIPADKDIYDFTMSSLSHIFYNFSLVHNIEIDAFIIYLLCEELDDKNLYKFLIDVKSDITDEFKGIYTKDEIKELLDKLFKGDIDSLTLLDNIEYDRINSNDSSFLRFELNNLKLRFNENYKKSVICDNVGDKLVAIGDNVLPEGIGLYNLIIEIEKLSDENIQNYVGEDKKISFSINQNHIGYFKVREKLPVCKMMYNNTIYTMIKYNDITYLLFNIIGDDKCYGISFPSGIGGARQLISFDIPTKYEYKLEI